MDYPYIVLVISDGVTSENLIIKTDRDTLAPFYSNQTFLDLVVAAINADTATGATVQSAALWDFTETAVYP